MFLSKIVTTYKCHMVY